MIYVYKQSEKPIHPWDVMRVGGANNIAPQVKAKYLVLWNVEAVYREGKWHYIFEFDNRDSLMMSGLAQMIGGGEKSYRDAADWKKWLGGGWELIGEKQRWEILNKESDNAAGEVIIHMKEAPTPTPMGPRKKTGNPQLPG